VKIPAHPKCAYCKAYFTPRPGKTAIQRFCCENHRKLYWKYGTLPLDKLLNRLRQEIRQIIREELNTSGDPSADKRRA